MTTTTPTSSNNLLKPYEAHYRFTERVLSHPSTRAFYGAYRGHIFRIVGRHPDPDAAEDHVLVTCVDDPKILVKGHVHTYDLELVNPLTDLHVRTSKHPKRISNAKAEKMGLWRGSWAAWKRWIDRPYVSMGGEARRMMPPKLDDDE